MGPAGSGKSTFCNAIYKHCEALRRSVKVVNLDPAAEFFEYPLTADIRDLIQVDDVMDDKVYLYYSIYKTMYRSSFMCEKLCH